LEARGLVQLLVPNGLTAQIPPGGLAVDQWHAFDEPYKLVDVAINWTHVAPASHPARQNELVMVLSGGRKGKPLIFVFGLRGHDELERLSREGALSADDFLAIEWPYDDSELSCFIVRGGAVHCEVTISGDRGAPHFFVVEPQDLVIRPLDLGPQVIQLG
jgi:hypothetical protein